MAAARRRRTRWFDRILVILMCGAPAAAAWGEEVDLSLRSELQYDERAVGGDGDFAVVLRPGIEVRDPDGRLRWEVDYRPFYEAFFDRAEASDLNHKLRLEGTWDMSPRTTIELSDRYLDLSRARLFNEQVVDEVGGEATVEDRTETNRITDNRFNAELRHRLSPLDTFVFSARHNLRDEEERELGDSGTTFGGRDRTNFGLTARYLRSISPKTTLGLGLSASRADVERRGRDDSETDFVNLFGTWQHQLDESLELSLRAGPTWVSSDSADLELESTEARSLPLVAGENVDATSCPTTETGRFFLSSECEGLGFRLPTGTVTVPAFGEVPESSDDTISFFANASVSKDWGDWQANLRYRRQESASGQLGSSTVADIVTGMLKWEPGERWMLRLTGQWNRRTQATDRVAAVLVVEPVGSGVGLPPETARAVGVTATTIERDFESTVSSARFAVNYDVTRRVRLLGRAFYSRRGGDFVRGSVDTDTARFKVGVEYDFDPIHF